MKRFGKGHRRERRTADTDEKDGKPFTGGDVLEISPIEKEDGNRNKGRDDVLAEDDEIGTEPLRQVRTERCIRSPQRRRDKYEGWPEKNDGAARRHDSGHSTLLFEVCSRLPNVGNYCLVQALFVFELLAFAYLSQQRDFHIPAI